MHVVVVQWVYKVLAAQVWGSDFGSPVFSYEVGMALLICNPGDEEVDVGGSQGLVGQAV